jgi:UDP:flavonoid glycosyltransferase YjiC (YdhE family)
MTAAGVIIERQPVPVDEIARRTRLLLNSAQSGIASLGLAAGLPQVCFPQHLEQLYVARQIADAGAGVSVGRSATTDEISTTIKTAYHDASLSARAREFSAEVRPYFAQDVDAIIRRRLERL